MSHKESRKTFQWSLKPLIIVTRLVGIPLEGPVTGSKCHRFFSIRLLSLVILSCFVLGLNLVINGHARLYDFSFIQKKIGDPGAFDSPFTYFKANPQGLIVLVKELIMKWLFACVPLVHLGFLVTLVFTREWNRLWGILQKIVNNMKLDEAFWKKCRNHGLVAALFLLMASNYSIIILKCLQCFSFNSVNINILGCIHLCNGL